MPPRVERAVQLVSIQETFSTVYAQPVIVQVRTAECGLEMAIRSWDGFTTDRLFVLKTSQVLL